MPALPLVRAPISAPKLAQTPRKHLVSTPPTVLSMFHGSGPRKPDRSMWTPGPSVQMLRPLAANMASTLMMSATLVAGASAARIARAAPNGIGRARIGVSCLRERSRPVPAALRDRADNLGGNPGALASWYRRVGRFLDASSR